MKRTKRLRTLEELWDLEDKHPLIGSSPAGLLRWMYATGMLNGRNRLGGSRRATASVHKAKLKASR